MTLRMLAFDLDPARLIRLAHRERLLPPGDDLGYAVHAVFAACFGDLAPCPWAWLQPGTSGGGPRGRLLGYSPAPLEELVRHASSFSDPTFASVLRLNEAAEKAMPDRFEPGTHLGFRVRVRPVIRVGERATGAGSVRKARERDAFLAAIEGREKPETVTRSDVYTAWLRTQVDRAGAELSGCRMEQFGFTQVLRRDRSAGARRPATVLGPDATFAGTLSVRDSERFAAGLARGIGRHRAFGFGMLLLSPPPR